MPIALRFSKRFYDTMGQEVVNEFVDALNAVDSSYRAEFRDLFAAHFGQLRAESDKQAVGLRGEMDKLAAGLRADMAKLDSQLRGEMAKLESNLRAEMAKLESSLCAGMGKLASAQHVNQLEVRLSAQDGRIAAFQEKVAGDLKGMKSELIGWMVGLWFVSVALAILTRAFAG